MNSDFDMNLLTPKSLRRIELIADKQCERDPTINRQKYIESLKLLTTPVIDQLFMTVYYFEHQEKNNGN